MKGAFISKLSGAYNHFILPILSSISFIYQIYYNMIYYLNTHLITFSLLLPSLSFPFL